MFRATTRSNSSDLDDSPRSRPSASPSPLMRPSPMRAPASPAASPATQPGQPGQSLLRGWLEREARERGRDDRAGSPSTLGPSSPPMSPSMQAVPGGLWTPRLDRDWSARSARDSTLRQSPRMPIRFRDLPSPGMAPSPAGPGFGVGPGNRTMLQPPALRLPPPVPAGGPGPQEPSSAASSFQQFYPDSRLSAQSGLSSGRSSALSSFYLQDLESGASFLGGDEPPSAFREPVPAPAPIGEPEPASLSYRASTAPSSPVGGPLGVRRRGPGAGGAGVAAGPHAQHAQVSDKSGRVFRPGMGALGQQREQTGSKGSHLQRHHSTGSATSARPSSTAGSTAFGPRDSLHEVRARGQRAQREAERKQRLDRLDAFQKPLDKRPSTPPPRFSRSSSARSAAELELSQGGSWGFGGWSLGGGWGFGTGQKGATEAAPNGKGPGQEELPSSKKVSPKEPSPNTNPQPARGSDRGAPEPTADPLLRSMSDRIKATVRYVKRENFRRSTGDGRIAKPAGS